MGAGRILASVFLLAAWGVTQAAAGHADAKGGVSAVVLEVHGKEFQFLPNQLKARRGDKVTIRFTNDGVLAHNFVIEALGVKSETIQPQHTVDVSFTPEKAGAFKIRCLVPGHMEAGMQGILTVAP